MAMLTKMQTINFGFSYISPDILKNVRFMLHNGHEYYDVIRELMILQVFYVKLI